MRAYVVFVSIHLMVLLSSINSSAVSVAFPNITAELNTSLVLAGWVLSIYQLVATGSMVLMGKVADVLGRKKTFLICSAFFIVGSLLCAVSPNIFFLILFRFIQSIGGGGLVSVVVGVIMHIFPNSRAKALGISMSVYNIGAIIGPNIGAWLVEGFGWKGIFWFNVPLGILACIPVILLMRTRQPEKIHIDFLGAGYFTACILLIMIGLSQVHPNNDLSGWLLASGLFVLGVLFIILFIRHEFRAKEPIIDLALLRSRPFAASNYYNFIFGVCMFGFTSFIPFYAISVYAMTTVESSVLLSARAIGMIAASIGSTFFLLRWGYRWPMLVGTGMIFITLLILGIEPRQVNLFGNALEPLMLLSAVIFISGVGVGVASPASNVACIDLMPNRASTIQGVRGMFRQSGGAISIAATTLILQYMNNISSGFRIVFIGTAILTLASVPFIIAMTDKARTSITADKP